MGFRYGVPLAGTIVSGCKHAVFLRYRRTGRCAGILSAALVAPPYRVDITGFLRGGSNEIRLDVYNTAINALAEGGRVPDV